MIRNYKLLLNKSVNIDEKAKISFDEISDLPAVADAVAFPDFHLKEKMETPSSVAIATKNHIVPHFSSCSLNCGTGLVSTGVKKQDFTAEQIELFFKKFRETKNEANNYDINKDEFLNILENGIEPVINKYSLPQQWLNRVESNGRIKIENFSFSKNSMNIIDPKDLKNVCYSGYKNLGLGFGGNHFLELQEVSEIFNDKICNQYNLLPGSIVIMYHSGGGILPGFIGAYFSRRHKSFDDNLRLFYNKMKFHMFNYEGLKRVKERWKYYFSHKKFVGLHEDSKEGERTIIANAAAMNYGYTYRMIAVARMRDTLRNIFSVPSLQVDLIHDGSHNSILKEKNNGSQYWIHRHNANRLRKNRINILPGFHTTSSYVGVGLENAENYLNSMSHGAGESIKFHMKTGITKVIPGKKTLKYLNDSPKPIEVEHVTDDGINSVIKILQQNGVFKPVARLTPIAVLKDYA